VGPLAGGHDCLTQWDNSDVGYHLEMDTMMSLVTGERLSMVVRAAQHCSARSA
jgi:hypothetical protein